MITYCKKKYGELMGHLQSFFILIARLAIAAIFVLSGLTKIMNWGDMLQYMTFHGIAMAEFFLFGAICVEIVGGLAIAFGWHMQMAAVVLVLYLLPVTYVFHGFWDISDPMMRAMQLIHFLKNLAIIGGLIALSMLSSGKYSVDRK